MPGSEHHEGRLYPLQDAVLAVISGPETGLYLSGGTAASRGYLGHRYSDDLDLFVNDDERFALWADRVVFALERHPDMACTAQLREPRFVRATVRRAENILANKITAALDRAEPKDLADDIWGFCRLMGLSLNAAIAGARSKAAGIFPADLARVLYGATEDDWAAIRWRVASTAERFVGDLKGLAEGLLLAE